MTHEERLYQQVKPRFVEFLKVSGLPFKSPALTICPHCGAQAGIVMESMWSCPKCHVRGDVVDYVMCWEHLDTKWAAIKQICHVLRVKITVLETITADELMDMQFEETNMLVDKVIGNGVYLIAGQSKIGKSWLMLQLAHSLSTGVKFLDFDTRQCEVLYISLEDKLTRIQARFAKVSGGESGRVHFSTEAELLGNGLEEQIIGFLTEHTLVKMVIIDTLQKVRDVNSSQYSYAGDYEIISRMKKVADRFGITILAVHHTRKMPASDPFMMISGTTGLMGGTDGSMVLIKDERTENRARLYATGRDTLDMELELVFDKDSAVWNFIGYVNDERVQKKDRLLSAINDLLIDTGGAFHGTATELLNRISERTELQIRSANALSRLLNPQKSILKYEYGIIYDFQRSGKERTLHLTRIQDDDSDDSLLHNANTVTIVTA